MELFDRFVTEVMEKYGISSPIPYRRMTYAEAMLIMVLIPDSF
jgi:hypothetical protein